MPPTSRGRPQADPARPPPRPAAAGERVFEVFRRHTASGAGRARAAALAACQAIVERHGGAVALERIARQGCVASVHLPRRTPARDSP